MSASDAQKQAFINRARTHATAIWNAQQALKALAKEWAALDYGTTMDDAADFTGDNEGLTKADVDAVVNTTQAAIEGLFDAGHGTNLAQIKY